MTTTTQQPPSNPALDFANSILEVTNNGLELIEILRDIANDCDEKATTNDRIAAANILTDRAFGKCPKQVSPSPDPTPEADDNGVEALREVPSAKPESPRLVTQIDDALHDSLGPPPSAHTPPRHSRANGNPESYDVSDSPEYETPDPSDPYSIHFTIQQHILAITNNGQTLRDILLEIARACPEPVEGAEDDPEDCPEPRRRVTPYHRRRAASLLLDRLMGTDPNALHSAVCPDCRRKWTAHPGSSRSPWSTAATPTPPMKKPFRTPRGLGRNHRRAQSAWKTRAVLSLPTPMLLKFDPCQAYMYKWATDEQISSLRRRGGRQIQMRRSTLRVERQKRCGPRSRSAGERSSPKYTRPTPTTTATHRIHDHDPEY